MSPQPPQRLEKILARLARGQGLGAMLLDVASQMEGHTICLLADAAAWPIQGLFRHFRGDIEARIAAYRSRKPHVQGATLQAAE